MFLSPLTLRTAAAVEPITPSPPPSEHPDFVVVDVETACSRVSSICQIGIVGFRDGRVVFEYETLIDPLDHFSSFNIRVHGITADHVAGQPCFGDVHRTIDGHLSGRTTVAHSYFDKGALAAACRIHGRPTIETTWLDSVRVAKRAWPGLPRHRLNVVAKHLGIPLKHHDALSDARAAGMIVVKAIDHTGIPVADWLSTPSRRRPAPAPAPAAAGILKGERVAILGARRDGALAHRVAAAGGRVMSAVGATTTILAVVADEPFGYVRYDAQFRRAEELARMGCGIRIISAAALTEEIDRQPLAAAST